MEMSTVIDHARKLRDAHGDRAIAEAAQKRADFSAAGDKDNAEKWRRIQEALVSMQGPRAT